MRNDNNQISWAAVFDWDGVIVDSAEYHRRSWELLAERHGFCLPHDHVVKGFGKRGVDIISQILGWADDVATVNRLTGEKGELYRELILSDGMEPMPGVLAWLDLLCKRNIQCGVGTSTSRANVECLLERWGWGERFCTIVSGEDVKLGKPDPAVFLLAAERIGVAVERVVVFEDSHFGLESAKGAGARRVAVAGTHPASSFMGVDLVVDRLDECDFEEISGWFDIGPRVVME